ncbi:MAG: UvrD-helicase domain-containing protein [Proteobacteria bacterium]|nr:UvrD-helicase domain-containing protein [Pseudomonadota bacterium]
MTSYLKNLNPEQRRAVETTEGPVLVLSGAGTGKTSVLVARVASILQRGLAKPWEILALTFTNKAANEMRRRISESLEFRVESLDTNSSQLSNVAFGDIWMGTFHSIALRILRRNAERIGVAKNFLVFGEDDQKAVMKSVIAGLGLDQKEYPAGDWIEKISAEKDKGIVNRESLVVNRKISEEKNKKPEFGKSNDSRITNHDSRFFQIYDAYNAELARLNAVDFGDLILKTLELFIAAPDVLQKYQTQFRYIMVDEYQDTNAAQYQLIRMLAAGYGNICCVGDDDQSIYSWRGAEIKNILNFEREYPGAKIIRLETNYRSTPAILFAANSLIRRNLGRLGKELRASPHAKSGEKVHVISTSSDYEEAQIIADTIQRANVWYSNFAVLIRAGSLSRAFEEEFNKRGIPYRLIGATKFYDRAEIKDAIAYLRLLVYPFDDLSFLRAISRPRRGIGDSAIQKLRDHARMTTPSSPDGDATPSQVKGNLSLMGALRTLSLSGKQKSSADEFIRAFDFNWNGMRPEAAASELLERSGYMKMWHESKDIDAAERVQNINELIVGVISKYDDLAEFLEHAALMMTEDDDDNAMDNGSVAVMTMHAAKGLEFDTVFMPAWEEGVFPNEMAINEGGLEEERRLAYVALTRAKNRAVITHAMSRLVFGSREYNPPSRFINEIDEEFKTENGQRTMEDGRWKANARKKKSFHPSSFIRHPSSMVGKLVTHPELGTGVVIEENDEILTIAFKDKGIKKVAKRFVKG